MSVRQVKDTLRQLTRDGMLDAQDIQKAVASAGKSVDAGEMNAIRDAVLQAKNINVQGNSFDRSGYRTTLEAFNEAQQAGVRFPMLAGELIRPESLEEAKTIRDTSFGGTPIPAAVKELLSKAYASGLEPFDVNDTKRSSSGEVKGVYSDYPSMSKPSGNMRFDYTEITPKALQDDKNDPSEYNVITPRSELGPGGQRMTRIDYDRRAGGTGDIAAHYDEGMHEDIYARGSSGQKWANNFAILSDGSIHALPAARRDEEGRVILTNPALARGKRVLYMGHLDVRGGVVQNVEMSGRLSRLAAQGEQQFIDPIALLKAWGFEMSPSLTAAAERGGGIQFSNTADGTPIRDLENGTLRQATP